MAEIVNEDAVVARPGTPVEDMPKTVDGRTITRSYRFYILLLLAVTYGMNMADRGVLGVLSPPLKKEFQLHDWQIGVLAGPVFALVYAVASMPLSALADRYNRRNLISATMFIFSAATSLCGLATTYLQLAFWRFLTGSVESATVPTANSMIADLYATRERVAATSIFTAGGSAGGILASLVGGFVAHHYGWREAFLVAGIPGMLIAILIFFTVREPRRQMSKMMAAKRPSVPMSAVLKHLRIQPAFFWLTAADALLMFQSRGSGSFTSLFLVQTHGLDLRQLGIFNSAFGVASIFVTLGIGRLTDKLAGKDIRWLMYSPGLVAALGIPFTLVLLLAENKWIALGVGGMGHLFGMAVVAPIIAGTQVLVPNVMRARALAFLVLIATALGMGVGPPVVGLVSDTLANTLGASEGLRWSLVMMIVPNVLGVLCFWKAAVTLKADVARARALDGLESSA